MDVSRITIEVGGYRWRVHGKQVKGKFQTHLVELLGNAWLDVPLTKRLRQELRDAIAQFLHVKVEEVSSIPTDLILA